LGCRCDDNGDDSSDKEVFGDECAGLDESADPFKEGYVVDLQDVIGFANGSSDWTWTVQSHFQSLSVLLFMSIMFLAITWFQLTDKD